MSVSRQEEIIATLWIIASLLAFNGGHTVWGYIFAFKGGGDIACALKFAIKEI